MNKIKLTLLLIIVTAFSFGQVDFKKLEEENFSISYPQNWRLDTTGQMNTSFILFSELKEEDLFQENVNLLIQDLSNQGFTINSYAKLSENQIKGMVVNGEIIESKFNVENNHHTLVWSGLVNNRSLKFKQYFFLKDEKAFVLTLTTLPETYDEYIQVGNKILNSFKIKE